MTRYLVIGAGAVGALLAAQLHRAGIATVLVARGRQLEAIREDGLLVRRPDSSERIAVPVVAGPHELALSADDVLVLATKTQDATAALAQWAGVPLADGAGLASELPVVTLQNGLATEDEALRRFRTVIGGTIWIAASYLVPGEVVSPSFPTVGAIWLGRYPAGSVHADAAPDPLAERIARDVDAAGYHSRAVADIRGWKTHKLLGNVSNGLDLFEDAVPDVLQRLSAQLVSEARAAFAAAGLAVADPQAELGISFGDLLEIRAVPGHTGGKRSTWQSFARGASSEADYLNGEIVLLGRRHGVPTPVNERLQRALAAAGHEGRVTTSAVELLDSAAPSYAPSLTEPAE